MNNIKLIINNSTLKEYEKYYFKNHPRASKKPIEAPYHPHYKSMDDNEKTYDERT